jgi:radical SAM protein with 4Fe4S-binding SPASM domain
VPGPDRLIAPVAVEVDIPAVFDAETWTTLCSGLAEAGCAFMNLVANGGSAAVLALAARLPESLELAITAPLDAVSPSVLHSIRIRPAWTLRVTVDMAAPPPPILGTLAAAATAAGAVVVLVGALPPHRLWAAWLGSAQLPAVRAVNVLDKYDCPPAAYPDFLADVAAFAQLLDRPLISDLPLMARYIEAPPFPPSRCPAGRLAAFVAVCGSLQPCRHVPHVTANLLDGTVETASVARRVADGWRAMGSWPQLNLPVECAACAVEDCKGGCRARADFGGRDRYCVSHQKKSLWTSSPQDGMLDCVSP